MRKLTLQQRITLSIIAKGNKSCAMTEPWYENFHTCPGKPKEMDGCAKRLEARGLITRKTSSRPTHALSGPTKEHYAIYQATSEGRHLLIKLGW